MNRYYERTEGFLSLPGRGDGRVNGPTVRLGGTGGAGKEMSVCMSAIRNQAASAEGSRSSETVRTRHSEETPRAPVSRLEQPLPYRAFCLLRQAPRYDLT